MSVTPDHLRAALALEPFDEEGARICMAHAHRLDFAQPEVYRDGAVLALFWPGEAGLTLTLTRRTDRVEHHRGQISFPGGKREDGETLVETALRESLEEVGIDPASVEILGGLPPLAIPVSGFLVHPFVGYAKERPSYRLDPTEVAGVIEVPLALLLSDGVRGQREWEFRGRTVMVPVFDFPDVAPPPLWGATAMMLSGLLERLKLVQ